MTTRPLAMITGASSGIGKEYARQLADMGYDLILVARRKERLDLLAAEITKKCGNSVDVLVADLSTSAGMHLTESCIQGHPQLEMLVNNAGYGLPGKFSELPVDETLKMVNVHVVATIRLTRAALPAMIAKHSGKIVNISSISAFLSVGRNPTYGATKGYIKQFSECLATELFGSGVIVQAVCPGLTRTEFHDSPEFQSEKWVKATPSSMWMTTQQVVSGALKALGHKTVYVPGFGNQLVTFFATIGFVDLANQITMKLNGKPLDI